MKTGYFLVFQNSVISITARTKWNIFRVLFVYVADKTFRLTQVSGQSSHRKLSQFISSLSPFPIITFHSLSSSKKLSLPLFRIRRRAPFSGFDPTKIFLLQFFCKKTTQEKKRREPVLNFHRISSKQETHLFDYRP